MSSEFSHMEIIDDLGKSKFCEARGDYFKCILLVVKVILVIGYGCLILLKAKFRIG